MTRKGFTLVELFIIIAILVILSVAVIFVLNPVELLSQGKDVKRIGDIRAMFSALSLFKNDLPGFSIGEPQTVYVSLADNSSTSCASHSLPSLPSGWSYRCVSSANIRKTDGSGWLPLNLNALPGGSPLPYLPISPDGSSGPDDQYIYVPDGWVLAAPLESFRYLREAAPKDGGFDPVKFEAGNDLSVIAVINQIIGIWDFNEEGGVLREIGVSGNDGTVFGNPAWVPGVSGQALLFDGIDDYTRVENQTGDSFSLSFWIKTSTPSLSGSLCADGNGIIASDIQGVGNDFSVTLLDNHVCFFTGNPDESVEGSVALNDGKWHNVIVSRERGGYKKVYVDGVSDGIGVAGNNVLNSNLNIEFGGSAVTNRYFSGAIDGVMIYNRILLDKEIEAVSRSAF